MDPNDTLSKIRSICASWEEWGGLENDPSESLDEIVELISTLDTWLTTGGFRPDDWS